MAAQFKLGININFGGTSYGQQTTVNCDRDLGVSDPVPLAKAGTLTVRTDNTTGSATLSTGHGITTGSRVDMYWLDPTTGDLKHRRGVVVGTVATNVVPISGGAGDNLPLAAATIQMAKPVVKTATITATEIVAAVMASDRPGLFVVTRSDDTEIMYVLLTSNKAVYFWYANGGVASPFSNTVGKVYMSHNATTPVAGASTVPMKARFGAN